jgi:hypothetical protein
MYSSGLSIQLLADVISRSYRSHSSIEKLLDLVEKPISYLKVVWRHVESKRIFAVQVHDLGYCSLPIAEDARTSRLEICITQHSLSISDLRMRADAVL